MRKEVFHIEDTFQVVRSLFIDRDPGKTWVDNHPGQGVQIGLDIDCNHIGTRLHNLTYLQVTEADNPFQHFLFIFHHIGGQIQCLRKIFHGNILSLLCQPPVDQSGRSDQDKNQRLE